jgi:hypothetical protein
VANKSINWIRTGLHLVTSRNMFGKQVMININL